MDDLEPCNVHAEEEDSRESPLPKRSHSMLAATRTMSPNGARARGGDVDGERSMDGQAPRKESIGR